MKIPHWYFCDYLTRYQGERPQHSWDANTIIRAIKGEPFNGYVALTGTNGVTRRYTEKSSDIIAARFLKHIGFNQIPKVTTQNMAVVPIPNSDMIPGSGDGHRVIKAANWLCQGFDEAGSDYALTLNPVLRWNEPKTPAHLQGGARHPSQYEGKFRLTGRIDQPVLLFDDVYTSGSQVKAAAMYLTKRGATVIGVTTVAKTVHEPSTKPISWRASECTVVETFDDWGL